MRKSLAAVLAVLLLLTACAPAADLGALEGRLSALETMVKSLAPAGADAHAVDPFDMAVAQYVMDTAGFHGMAETLAETKIVDPAYLSTVNRVKVVLASAPWPETLTQQGETFVALLGELAVALEADNGEEAARLAEETHAAQHDLSHAIGAWLGAASGDAH